MATRGITVKGLAELQKKMTQMVTELDGPPMFNAMREASLIIQRAARRNLRPWRGPGTGGADTGRLKASIIPDVRQVGEGNYQGVVGTNVFYAPYQEFGTRPHFVPKRYIGTWARRHGLGDRGVFVSGKALRFMGRAFDENEGRVQTIIERAVATIVRK
jgi:HK97 gp10 family phage protein